MRPAAPSILLLATFLSGCAVDDPAATAALDQPMDLEVLDAEEGIGRCNNPHRDQGIITVSVRLTNLASVPVGPAEYDVHGADESGEDYPMCWPDEVAVPAGDSLETDLRFYVTSEECDVLQELGVRQLFLGQWVESRVPTGLEDPC